MNTIGRKIELIGDADFTVQVRRSRAREELRLAWLEFTTAAMLLMIGSFAVAFIDSPALLVVAGLLMGAGLCWLVMAGRWVTYAWLTLRREERTL